MNISNRLKTVASFVKDNSYILDVGCDHALLDIYLVNNKKNITAIASDINKEPLKQAKENIKKYNLTNEIKLINSDGLDEINNKIDTVILSGLGTTTIINILKKDKNKLNNIKNLIISSNNDYYELRKEITKLGFIIKDEKLVLEKNIYYPIILFEKGNKKYNKLKLKYGPIILTKKDQVFNSYLEKRINKLDEINKKLTFKHLILKHKNKKEIKEIRKLF